MRTISYAKIHTLSVVCLLALTTIPAQTIEVFNDGDFKGDSDQYSEGDYDKLQKLNDKISSIRISKGLQVVVYEHGTFKGKNIVLTSDVKNLNNYNFNDKISSIKVQSYQKNSDAVTAYEHGDFKGKILPLSAKEYNDLGKLSWMNDNISSIRISSDCQVIAFENGDYKGKKIIITSDQSNMNDLKFNDKISSIIVECGQDKGSYALNSKGDSKDKFITNKGEKKIIASGFGANPDQALQKALRNAVEEAVGSYISSNTLIENDDLIEDKILSLSRGFIKDFRTLSTEKIDGETKVTVAAIVTGDQVIETLKSSGVEVKIKGNLLFSQFSDFQRQMDDEAKLVGSLFSEVPKNSIVDYNISYAQPVQLENPTNSYKIKLTISANINKNYTILMQNIKNVLDAIALDYTDIKIDKKSVKTFSESELGENRTIPGRRGENPINKNYAYSMTSCIDGYLINNRSKGYLDFEPNKCKPSFLHINGRTSGNMMIREISSLWLIPSKEGVIFSRNRTPEELENFNNRYPSINAKSLNFIDLFEKGQYPYYLAIMISDEIVRIYRLISESSFIIVNKYLETYLHSLNPSISLLLNSKLSGMDDNKFIVDLSVDVKEMVSGNWTYNLSESSGKINFINKNEHSKKPLIKKLRAPGSFSATPPLINKSFFTVEYRNYFDRVHRENQIRPFSNHLGAVSFLPNLKEKDGFFKIETYLVIDSSILKTLEGIKIY